MPTSHHLSSTRIRYARGLARELAVLDRLEHLLPEDRPSAIAAEAASLIRAGFPVELATRNTRARVRALFPRTAANA